MVHAGLPARGGAATPGVGRFLRAVIGMTRAGTMFWTAVLWTGGTLILPGAVLLLPGTAHAQSYTITDAGQIAALASLGDGSHAVRLDPIPGGLGLGGPEPGAVGRENTLAVRGATVGENVVCVYGFAEGTSRVPGCPGLSVDIAGARILATDITDGHALVTAVAPEAVGSRTVLFQAVERTT